MDTAQSLHFHREAKGKIHVAITREIRTKEDLMQTYTPGVAVPARAIAEDPERVWELTGRRNRVAILSNGSAVLGLGNIGPAAALPVMEGKAALFKQFADIDAFPIVIDAKSPAEIIETAVRIAPSFGGILLEDIAAPVCFEVEETLKKILTIPVFHDDQHGTAIVVLAGLMNALRVRDMMDDVGARYNAPLPSKTIPNIVISGAGAAGTAIARLLLQQGFHNVIVCDSRGIIDRKRDDLNAMHKTFLAAATNSENRSGTLADALQGADIFIGVSKPNLVTSEMIHSMQPHPILFALANPDPEITREEALQAGAAIVATGRSGEPNQMNNLLVFPGLFRGTLDAKAAQITEEMKLGAAKTLASLVPKPTAENILPNPLEKGVAQHIAHAVTAVVTGASATTPSTMNHQQR